MLFTPLTLENYSSYKKHWIACPQKTSDYSFLNIWTWNGYYKFELAEYADLIWIKDGAENFRAPVGNWQAVDFTKLDFFNEERKFLRVPEELKNILQEQFKERAIIEDDPNNAEYIYNQSDLATLKGNKFQKKRNHFNGFNKTYGVDYRAFSGENLNSDLEYHLKELQEAWCMWSECMGDISLKAESEALQSLIDNLKKFPEVIGGALYVENKLIAFSLGEKLDEKTFVVHFEKAHPDYRGAFQAINKCFAENAGAEFEFINREQDLGDEGLRQAKHTYNPVHFLNKYTVTIK